MIVLCTGALLTAQDSPRPALSTGSAIQNAAKAAAQDRVTTDANQSANAVSPENGTGKTSSGTNPERTCATVLSDTGGFNFAPYLRALCAKVRLKWYVAVNRTEYGKYANTRLAIEFVIKKDGSITGMKLLDSSGDETLDQAAWTGIKDSAPFEALPPNYKGDLLRLRTRFFYNPSLEERYRNRHGDPPPPSM